MKNNKFFEELRKMQKYQNDVIHKTIQDLQIDVSRELNKEEIKKIINVTEKNLLKVIKRVSK